MKKSKIGFLAVILVFAFAATSMATVVGYPFGMWDPYGRPIDSQTPQQLIQIDLNDFGTALAVDANRNNPPMDAPFELLFQTYATAFTRLVGGNPTPALPSAHLNGIFGTDATSYEFTVVGRLWENYSGYAADLPPGGATSSFSLAPTPAGENPGMMEIWADSPIDADGQANISAGTGYRNGNLILSATPTAIPVSSFSTAGDSNGNGIIDNQDDGSGSSIIVFSIDSWDTDYFDFVVDPLNPGGLYMIAEFNTQLYTPPGLAVAAAMWDGTIPDIYTQAMLAADLAAGHNTGNPATDPSQDLMFRLDGSIKTAPIPEPATMLLLGSGLLGLASYTRKKSKK